MNELRRGDIGLQLARVQLQACRDLIKQVDREDTEQLKADLGFVQDQIEFLGIGTPEFPRLVDHLADMRQS